MTISELYKKRANAWENAKNFLDERSTNGMMSAEDAEQYERMEKDIQGYTDSINRMQRAADIENEMGKAVNHPLSGKPSDEDNEETKGVASKGYKDAFNKYIHTKNRHSISSSVMNALEEGTDSEGGYLVPDEFDKTLVAKLAEENVMRRLATIIRTTNGDHKIAIDNDGTTVDWIDEEGAYNENTDPSFGQITLGAHKLGGIKKVSEELLADSAFDLENYLANEFARACGTLEENAFIGGNGTGKPTGLLDATNGAATGVTTASATAITADELIDLFHSLKTSYRRNAVWLMNDAIAAKIRKLKTGDGVYLWQPGLQAGAPDVILGKTVYYTPAMEATVAASKRIIAFGDMSYYWIAERGARTLRRLDELYAANGQVGFRVTERVDGRLMLTEAVKCMLTHA